MYVSPFQILLTPVFVVRSDFPLILHMNIETPRLKSRHQVELPGHGSENQLHTMSAEMTHNVTFRLGYACETLARSFCKIIVPVTFVIFHTVFYALTNFQLIDEVQDFTHV